MVAAMGFAALFLGLLILELSLPRPFSTIDTGVAILLLVGGPLLVWRGVSWRLKVREFSWRLKVLQSTQEDGAREAHIASQDPSDHPGR